MALARVGHVTTLVCKGVWEGEYLWLGHCSYTWYRTGRLLCLPQREFVFLFLVILIWRWSPWEKGRWQFNSASQSCKCPRGLMFTLLTLSHVCQQCSGFLSMALYDTVIFSGVTPRFIVFYFYYGCYWDLFLISSICYNKGDHMV